MDTDRNDVVARLVWEDPHSHKQCEYPLHEGATVTIGRSANNDIQIAEQHVSRQHATIAYHNGVFMIEDLGSANGTFVNDHPVKEPFPLCAGDVVRLHTPILYFMAADDGEAPPDGEIGVPAAASGQGSLLVTNGPQEGQIIPLLLDSVQIGRATSNASWEIVLRDPSVSRPHACIERTERGWVIRDLGSSNGTAVNNEPVGRDPHPLQDGDTIALGGSVLVFRAGWARPVDDSGTGARTVPPDGR